MIDHADTIPLIRPEDAMSPEDLLIYETWLDSLYWKLRTREDKWEHDMEGFDA